MMQRRSSRPRGRYAAIIIAMSLATLLGACRDDPEPEEKTIASGIFAPMGEVMPGATEEQVRTFGRGEEVARRRFSPETGLGPRFNVTFCIGCHESPAPGGGAPRYRDFFIQAQQTGDGSVPFTFRGGIAHSYSVGDYRWEEGDDGEPGQWVGDSRIRPGLLPGADFVVRRNGTPFYGVGLLAEIYEEAILANADPNDEDGDGISGRPNYVGTFVGRFGRKAQTENIEGFIRGPIFNHLGITTDPLTNEQRSRLPVDSSDPSLNEEGNSVSESELRTRSSAQVGLVGERVTDSDDAPDPELSTEDLFDLVSYSMLLAVPAPEPPTAQTLRGEELFHEMACASCHVPTLEAPRGLIPLYSDLLIHDMGPGLDDGFKMADAEGFEWRTQPLWGVVATDPYMHDGSADTLDEAILLHGGEAQASRDAYVALTSSEQEDVIEFLSSLGGRDQASEGLLPPNTPLPEVGEVGGPWRELDEEERVLFEAGRAAYDRNIHISHGLGDGFNGDSCRACHFDPVIGGAGPLGVNVVRHGRYEEDGSFAEPPWGTALPKLPLPGTQRYEDDGTHNHYEFRQTPTTLGLGLIDTISEADILANADPDDLDGDGIRGIARMTSDGRVGRFGWKAGIATLEEFARDATSNELGLTLEPVDGMLTGVAADSDDVADPEADQDFVGALTFFMSMLAGPLPVGNDIEGRELFTDIGCADCHIPSMPGISGDVMLYSDLLLHVVTDDEYGGVFDGDIDGRHYRTAPLWGIRHTAPYMHHGLASTLEAAIADHGGEATASREAYEALPDADQVRLIEFLKTL